MHLNNPQNHVVRAALTVFFFCILAPVSAVYPQSERIGLPQDPLPGLDAILAQPDEVETIKERTESVPKGSKNGRKFALEGRCPTTIYPEDTVEVQGLEGIYQTAGTDLTESQQNHVQFAFQPPHNKSTAATDIWNKYRVITGQASNDGDSLSNTSFYKMKLLPLTYGWIGVSIRSWPECRFILVTKDQSQFVYSELSLSERALENVRRYSDLVRTGDFWIQKYQNRLFVEYGTTSRDIMSFFNQENVKKFVAGMPSQRLTVQMVATKAIEIAEKHYRIALDHLAQKNYSSALKELDLVVQLKPALSKGYLARGAVRYELHRYKEALEDFKQAVDIAPENRDAQMQLSDAYIKTGDTEGAFSHLRRAIHLPPQDGKPQYAFSALSALTGDLVFEGGTWCVEAAKINPSFKSCFEAHWKVDADEKARSAKSSSSLSSDQQDFLSGLFTFLGAAVVIGALTGSSHDSVTSTFDPIVSSPVRSRLQVCTKKCTRAAGTVNGQYCSEVCY